eukprot:1006448-Pelagomonas_calceolata.AAC.3
MGDLTFAFVSVLTSLLMARRSLARRACSSATAWNCVCTSVVRMHKAGGSRREHAAQTMETGAHY